MSSRNCQKLLLLSPALTPPLAEEKSWTFPQFYMHRRKGPESQALGNLWVSWARTQVPESQCWDDFGSKNHHVTEKHGGIPARRLEPHPTVSRLGQARVTSTGTCRYLHLPPPFSGSLNGAESRLVGWFFARQHSENFSEIS